MNNKIDYLNQRFELLTIYNEFKKDIVEFRNNCKIAVSTEYKFFSCKNILIEPNRVYTDFNNIFSAIGEYNRPFLMKSKFEECVMLPDSGKFYSKAFIELMKKYNLSHRYAEAVTFYIYTGQITSIPLLGIGYPSDEGITKEYQDEIIIRVFPDTNIKDVKDVWSVISKWQKETLSNNGRDRKSDSYEIMRRIWELHNSNKSNDQILSIINNEFLQVCLPAKTGKRGSYIRIIRRANCESNEIYKNRIPNVIPVDIKDSLVSEYVERAKKRVLESDLPTTAFLKSNQTKSKFMRKVPKTQLG